jgi:uncharacterized delta-60 repeat protein
MLVLVASILYWPLPTKLEAAAGDLDPSFGSGGIVVTDFFAGFDFATSLAIQSDGKIVAAGQASNEFALSNDFALARYNSNGSLDTSFGSGGKVITDFFGGEDGIDSLAVQSDGKLVVAGFASTGGLKTRDFALARYNADGSLDTSFGSGGKIKTDFFGDIDEARDVAVQSDGKLVVAGFASTDGLITRDFALARYDTNGSLDTSFGSGGKIETDFFGDIDEAHGVAIQSDGRIVLAGKARGLNPFDFALARYNVDGSLDASFGSGGKLITNFGNTAQAFNVILQTDGKIVAVGGRFDALTEFDFALARYNSDGSLDASFGSGGLVATAISDREDVAFGVALHADGRIVVAGRGSAIGFFSDFALARYNSDGSLDASFGSGGKIITDFSSERSEAGAVAVQPNNKIVAAGFANGDFALARYDGGGFDLCLQDDSGGNLLLFNSTTGEYQFTRCSDGFTLAGTGIVTIDGCRIMLKAKASNHSINASVDTCQHTGNATVVLSSQRRLTALSIIDTNTGNNTCRCPNSITTSDH